MKKVIKFISCIFGPLVLGGLSALLVGFKSYNIINKPILSPPALVFPLAWSILYLSMGISLYMAINVKNNNKAIRLFFGQLIINLLWTPLFFSFKMYLLAALWLLLLIVVVIELITELLKVKKEAGYLQMPYLLWLLFALYLNIGVAILN